MMGRASRSKDALKRALAADNRGNRLRKLWARHRCLELLAGDLRIQEAFQGWVRDQRAVDGPPDWVETQADFDRAVAIDRQQDIDALALVLQQMGVRFEWCAPVLVAVSFPVMLHNLRQPEQLRGVEGKMELVGVQRGQAPPHDGKEIEANVEWWYRAKIKNPQDSISALAEEYAKREDRVTDCRSVIQIGIERAEILLEGRILGWKDS